MAGARHISRTWLRLAVCVVLASLAVPVLDFGFEPAGKFSFGAFSIGFLYSLLIGGILAPISPIIWRKTGSMGTTARWAIRGMFIASGAAVGCLLAGVVRMGFEQRFDFWRVFVGSYSIALILSLITSTFLSMSESYRERLADARLQLKENEIEREKALKIAAEATLASLESRMHPHFLFNTINSISALIQEDPARAEKMLSQMAELLRFSLDSARAGLVPLASEVRIVRQYLEIEKARFEDRLRYRIDAPNEFGDIPFPPLSLQTLVENSVKYAVSVSRMGADIAIRATRENGLLFVSVEDNGPGFDAADLPAGHGLSSLRARLASLYGGDAGLDIASSAEGTLVRLSVPAGVTANRL